MAVGLDPGPPERGAEPGRGGRTWLGVLLALAAGWGAFLAYSAVFLTEDAPLHQPAIAEREVGHGLEFPAPNSGAMQAARQAGSSPAASAMKAG